MMKRHDDPFFEHVRQELQDFEAAPPAGTYAGIRSKMGGNSFLRFSWYRMNVYYAALLVSGTIALALVSGSDQMPANAIAAAGEDAFDISVERKTAAMNTRTEELQETAAASVASNAVKTAKTPETSIANSAKTNPKGSTPQTSSTSEKEVVTLASGEEAPHSICPDAPSTSPDKAEEETLETSVVETDKVERLEARQLPNDWLQRAAQPDLSKLVQDLQSDQETIFLTLPVKVSVEKED